MNPLNQHEQDLPCEFGVDAFGLPKQQFEPMNGGFLGKSPNQLGHFPASRFPEPAALGLTVLQKTGVGTGISKISW